DDTRYRERDEVKAWAARDPLSRMQAYLAAQGVLDESAEQRIASGAEDIAAALRDALNADAEQDPEDLFRFVTAERSPQLQEQWQLLRGEIERAELSSTIPVEAGGHR